MIFHGLKCNRRSREKVRLFWGTVNWSEKRSSQWLKQSFPLKKIFTEFKYHVELTVSIQVVHALGLLLLLLVLLRGQNLLRGRLCRVERTPLPLWRRSSQSYSAQRKSASNKSRIRGERVPLATQLTVKLLEHSWAHEFQESVCVKTGPVNWHRVLKRRQSSHIPAQHSHAFKA